MGRNREKAGNSLQEGLSGTNSMLMSPSVERTARRKETTGKFLWSSFQMRLKKASRHAGQSVKKKNMRRSAFVAVIPLLFFTGLCVLSLLGRQPLASAVGAHHSILHDSGSSSSESSSSESLYTGPKVDCTDLNNASSDQCFGGGSVIAATPPTQNTVSISSDKDYNYLDGDPTCRGQDPASSDSSSSTDSSSVASSSSTDSSSVASSSSTDSSSVASPSAAVLLGGQYTCHDSSNSNYNRSVCYSDNGSGRDKDSMIHDYSGGDNVICYNPVCQSDEGSQSGDVCGYGMPYDRFACTAAGLKTRQGGGGLGIHFVEHQEVAIDVYYNNTAYMPENLYIVPTLHGKQWNYSTWDPLHVQLDSRHDPSCEGMWSCPGDDPVIIDKAHDKHEIYSPYGSLGLQEVYWVMCGSSGAAGKPTVVGACTHEEKLLQRDWLSGDMGAGEGSGHLVFTALNDTVNAKFVRILFSDMLVIAYALILPVCALIGYQMFIASWSGRTAGLQDTVPRVFIGVLAIAVSYQLVTMLIEVFDILNMSVVYLHKSLPYPAGVVAGGVFTYTDDKDPLSYRGIVIPVNQWGCTINDFVDILTQKLISDLASFLPFIGGVLQFALGIKDAIELFERLAEFLQFLLSVNLCVQLFIRIIMINYYILMAPVAFGCWGLPAGVGEKVVGQWAKGFLSVLFIQTVQLFVLTTLPLLAPAYPDLATNFHVMNEIFRELPKVIVLAVVVQVPKLMGGGAGKVMAQAGSVASGAVAAVGAAAYQMV